MILSDRTIRERIDDGGISIQPLDEGAIQPASVDLRVGDCFRVFHNHRLASINLSEPVQDCTELVKIEKGGGFVLHPAKFVLASTLERVVLADDIVARLEGKSSLGRLGLLIHSTAGFVDPGWRGHLTLELSNVSELPIIIEPGLKIAQISFMSLTTPADRPYGSDGLGSRYQHQRGPVASRYGHDRG